MGQREEEAQWDLEKEAERRGMHVKPPRSKHNGMQADWAIDAMLEARANNEPSDDGKVRFQ